MGWAREATGPISLTPLTEETQTVSCDTGYIALSGGYDCNDYHVWVLESYQESDGSGWTTTVMSDVKESRSCTFYAVCVQVPAAPI
jgi:hypothetical protein